MGKDWNEYKKIPAIGQADPTACWAACLSWWLKAVRDVSKSQGDMFWMFNSACFNNGTINLDVMKTGIARNNAIFKMKTEMILPDKLVSWVGDYRSNPQPTIIAFTTPNNTEHMNVLYGIDNDWDAVFAMEPWFPDLSSIEYPKDGSAPYINGSDKFTGTHIGRWINYYKQPLKGKSGIFVGSAQ